MLDIFFKTVIFLIKVQWAYQVALLSLGSGLEMTSSAVQIQWLFSQGTVIKKGAENSLLFSSGQQLLTNRAFKLMIAILVILTYIRDWMMKCHMVGYFTLGNLELCQTQLHSHTLEENLSAAADLLLAGAQLQARALYRGQEIIWLLCSCRKPKWLPNSVACCRLEEHL